MRNLLLLLAVVAAPLHAQAPFEWYGRWPYRPAVPRVDSLLGHGLGTRHTMYHEQQRALDRLIAAAPMADLRLFRRRGFAATGFVAFAISATVIGMIAYLSLYVQNTLGYSPVQAGLRFLPLFLASETYRSLTTR